MHTIGVDFKMRTIQIDSRNIRLQCWDTAGQERYRTITSSYYRGAHAILVVFDTTNRETFLNVRKWLDEVERYAVEDVAICLVGTKSDLKGEREVTTEEAREFAQGSDLAFVETSAKFSTNVQELFFNMTEELVKKFDNE